MMSFRNEKSIACVMRATEEPVSAKSGCRYEVVISPPRHVSRNLILVFWCVQVRIRSFVPRECRFILLQCTVIFSCLKYSVHTTGLQYLTPLRSASREFRYGSRWVDSEGEASKDYRYLCHEPCDEILRSGAGLVLGWGVGKKGACSKRTDGY